jgi:hypothetical protein
MPDRGLGAGDRFGLVQVDADLVAERVQPDVRIRVVQDPEHLLRVHIELLAGIRILRPRRFGELRVILGAYVKLDTVRLEQRVVFELQPEKCRVSLMSVDSHGSTFVGTAD